MSNGSNGNSLWGTEPATQAEAESKKETRMCKKYSRFYKIGQNLGQN
jgi:hypothetical protein